MRDERPGRRTAGQRLQDRRLHFQKPAPFQCVAYPTDNGDSLAGHRTRLRADDQIDIALPNPRFFAHFLVRHRQRP